MKYKKTHKVKHLQYLRSGESRVKIERKLFAYEFKSNEPDTVNGNHKASHDKKKILLTIGGATRMSLNIP